MLHWPSPFSRRTALTGLGVSGLALLASGSVSKASSLQATPVASPVAQAYSTVPTIFRNETFNFEFLLKLGATFEQAADIGECFAVASRITDGDYASWCNAWVEMGDRLKAIGEASDAIGARVSAREAYLRASSYYASATWLSLGTDTPDQLVANWELHRNCLDAFFARLDVPAEMVEIPYEDTTLPGYALRVDDSGAVRPWIILNNGSDGSDTDMWTMGAAGALRRGYNVLIFDGPGQNAALFRQKLYFRPDWEAVITPVVDYLLTRSDVDAERIALSGVSQAGYWVPRAVAFEHRIAAAVADPGVFDVGTSWTSNFPPEFDDVLQQLYAATGDELAELVQGIDSAIAEEAAGSPDLAFTIAFRTYPYGTDSVAEMLRLLREYTLEGVLDKVTCPVLVTDPEGESFWPGQSDQVYDALPSEMRTIARFTAAEGADLHCEPKAMGRRSQVIFDWLDGVLDYHGS
jgi:hypothetical protein